METDQRIAEERARINALNSSLDAQRAPFLKNQLRLAGCSLDDALDALRFAAKAESKYVAAWLGYADMSIHIAIQRREKVHALVDTYGGPEKVMEVGGPGF